ncbi:hypothetical protein FD755_024337, partial [Muntiacus reevesi]
FKGKSRQLTILARQSVKVFPVLRIFNIWKKRILIFIYMDSKKHIYSYSRASIYISRYECHERIWVTLDNCVEVGRIANTYNLTEVDKYVNSFVLKNFPALLSTGEFLKLPFERLAFVLSSNSLKHCTELELFKATCRWLRLEEPRMDFAAKLMKNIRFPLMTPQELINYVQTVDFMRTDNTCVNLLLEASNYQMMPYMQPVMQSDRTAIRSDTTHLVTLGGVLRQQLVVSKELRMYDEKAHEWKSLAPMDAPRYQHGIAVIGNFLYVVGGQSNYDTKGKTAVDTVFRFDPRYNKWMQVASLNEKRTFFHLSALKGYLYAVGGRNAAGELPTVECYNPRTNEWTYVAKMSEPHYGHAGTVYGGVMYISGSYHLALTEFTSDNFPSFEGQPVPSQQLHN